MSAEDQIIRCLLCRCIVTSEKDDVRYKDHLKVEHRVYFFMSWIVDKTRIENKEESTQKASELENILKPSNQLQTKSQMQVVDVSNRQDHAIIDNKFEEKIDDEKDDDLAWEALSNVMAQISDVSDDSMHISDENKSQTVNLKMMSFNNSSSIHPDQIAANLVKKEAILNQNKAQMTNPAGENDDEGDYSNQLNNFFKQSTGMDATPNMIGGESKKAFLLVYPGEDGKSLSYRCSICTGHQSFDSKSKAEQHLKAHIPLHERKRFQCSQCKERFVTAKTLEKHTKLALCQGIKISSCNICKLHFDNKFDLRDHKKTTHKILGIKNNKKSKEASRIDALV